MKFLLIKTGTPTLNREPMTDADIGIALAVLFRLCEGWTEFSILRNQNEIDFLLKLPTSFNKRNDWLRKRIVGEFSFYDLPFESLGVGATVKAAERNLKIR